MAAFDPIRGSVGRSLGAVLAMALMTGAVFAQATGKDQPKTDAKPAAGAAAAAPKLVSPEWLKGCGKSQDGKNEACEVLGVSYTEEGQWVTEVVVADMKRDGKAKKVIRALLPLQLMIQPGVNFIVDQNKPLVGKFEICVTNGCYATAEVSDEFFQSFRKGNTLTIAALNRAAKPVGFPIALAGFSKSYDGDAIEPKEFETRLKAFLETQQKKAAEKAADRTGDLQKGLQKKADEIKSGITPEAGQ